MNTVVPHSRFIDAFSKLAWSKSTSSGPIEYWISPNKDLDTVIMVDESKREYAYYQNRNIKLLVYFLGLDDVQNNYDEVLSQLISYNYKLINRIVGTENASGESIPYEVANYIPKKNIDAFRSYYLSKSGAKSIPIENFELNHTRKGSFIIPISLKAELYPQDTLIGTPTLTNRVLREYLDKVDFLAKLEHTDVNTYADKVIEAEIDSSIVKDFFSRKDSIAKMQQKYTSQIGQVDITSTGSPILDYALQRSEKTFKTVDLERMKIIPDNFITHLEEREIEADSATREEHGASIKVLVDSIEYSSVYTTGKAKFSVFLINNEKIKKPFKATSVKLSKNRLNVCAGAFISRDLMTIKGDIIKSKGKIGEIIVDDLNLGEKSETLTLFSDNEVDRLK